MSDLPHSEAPGIGGEKRKAKSLEGTGSTCAERKGKTVPMHGAKCWAGAHVL